MRDLGQWERAIAVAPAVSLEFWMKLAKQYAQEKVNQNASRLYEALPWYVAVNQPETLANLYINNEQFDEAVVLAQVAAVGGYDELTSAGG
eukprot:3835195-Pyramimonas_sp.AAC.1